MTVSGPANFRYDYRLSGRRETLTIGRHEPAARHAQRTHLAYGMDVTLEEARLLLARARVDVSSGRSPARAKVEQRSEVADAMSFGRWAAQYFEFKSDAKSGAEQLADSTLALRRSIYNRILAGPFGKLNLDEVKPIALGELLDRVKTERGPGPAVHTRELVLQVYRFAIGKGLDVAGGRLANGSRLSRRIKAADAVASGQAPSAALRLATSLVWISRRVRPTSLDDLSEVARGGAALRVEFGLSAGTRLVGSSQRRVDPIWRKLR